METKASTNLSKTRNNVCKSESDVAPDSGFEPCESDSQLSYTEVLVKQDQPIMSTSVHADFELGNPIGKRKRDCENEVYDSCISIYSVKKARMTIEEDKPTVHVKYGSLTRKSKQKLEELLQQWSEWHTQQCSPTHDSNEILESGEGTYFPALRVGVDNSSPVTFWMNNPFINQLNKAPVSVDCKTAPLYDRGYSLEGDSKKLDAFRCFNCGSYSHSLKECPKPRDNVAINNAHTQHQSNHNQRSSSFRRPTRYYQNSPSGKYDGLIPGVLQAETRQLLGLGELDPPPWLHRMREIGYPPGYLDPDSDDDNRPSGITIFADEEENENNGKVNETDSPPQPPPRKMSVQFPGVNAPIPENADEKKWTRPASSFDLSRSGPFPRPNNHLYQSPYNNNQRWHSHEIVPPGCDPGHIPPPFTFSPMYSNHNISGGYHSPINLSPYVPKINLSPFPNSPLAYGSSLQHSSSPNLSPYLLPQHDGGHFSQVDYSRFGYERRY